jgi:hypothetical protein
MRTLYLPASSVADPAPAQPSIYSATANSQSMSASVKHQAGAKVCQVSSETAHVGRCVTMLADTAF